MVTKNTTADVATHADQLAPALVAQLLADWGRDRRNLLPMLIQVQHSYNHIPSAAIDELTLQLAIPATEIRGIIGFYSFLHEQPRGSYDVYFSDNIIDRMHQSRARAAQLSELTGCALGKSSGSLSIDFTSCTGLSDQGPGMLVNGHALSSMDQSRIARMAQYMARGIPVSAWPEEWFRIRDNICRRDIVLSAELVRGDALRAFLSAVGPDGILRILDASGLRGRGGAGFSTARKWATARAAPGPRVVVCNADEGEPGTFKDRVLLQTEAHAVIEGMTLCAATIGADRGFIYLRGEYRFLRKHLEEVLAQRREDGLLGQAILGREDFNFDIQIHLGAGSYVCGEESALIESLEGQRGIPRNKPPFPAEEGYRKRPTVVNNVETFLKTTLIAHWGSAWFRAHGTLESGGTKVLSVSGDCTTPGIYEYPFGTPVREVLMDCGARNTAFVQIGGPAGQTLVSDEFDRTIAFEDIPTGGSFMIFDDSRPVLDVVANFMDFFVHESCGFCTPCRVGGTLMQRRLRKVMDGRASAADLEKIREIGAVMRSSSQCGLGRTAPNPVLDTLQRFPEIYRQRLCEDSFSPAFILDDALAEARSLTGRKDAGDHLGDSRSTVRGGGS